MKTQSSNNILKEERLLVACRLLFIFIIVAALLGTFGGGWLSYAEVQMSNTQLKFDRIIRSDRNVSLNVFSTDNTPIRNLIFKTPGELEIINVFPSDAVISKLNQITTLVSSPSRIISINYKVKTNWPKSNTISINDDELKVEQYILP